MQLSVVNGVFGGMSLDESLKYLADHGVHQLELGVGGYPRGRIIEIYGPESSGKTTLAILAIAQAQKQGGIAAIIDAEHAFDRFYAEKLGVDVNNLWI